LCAQLAQRPELARLVDVFEQLMGLAVDDFVAAVDGEQSERFGGVSVANSQYERIRPCGAVLVARAAMIRFAPCATS
jgi:hypothetical protein